MPNIPELIFLIVFAAILVWVAFVFLTKKGRNVMFGGTIIKTFDEVQGKRRIVTARVRVHAVEVAPTVRLVGLEITASSIGSFQMMPISLPAREAKELARMLVEAAEYQRGPET